MGTRITDKRINCSHGPTQPKQQVGIAWLEHFWSMDSSRAYTDSLDSPWPILGGSHHLPPHIILCTKPHPNVILSYDSQVGSPKIPKIGIPAILKGQNFLCKPPIKVRSKKHYSLCWELSNNMCHATYTHIYRSDSWFLVVRNQIGALTPNLSFGHNLCIKYSNGSCELILNIYVSIAFQWYKGLFNPMNFDLWNTCLKI